ncbi:MAG: hypothetical protein A2V98_02295 [Planctomycetes bacterium RBG_16_64_12]|nr:MAG: hypothetical protein A2V98_02295 [Planctomycetes bacterium RBG_16_64_12]
MDQNTLREFLKIVWGALFAALGVIAALCLFLILRSGIFRSFHFREPREIEEDAPWRERIREWLRQWRPPRK